MSSARLDLQGVLAPLTTPFAPDESLDLEGLKGNVRRYNTSGLLGYVVAGSTGESVFLSRDEKISLWEVVAGAADTSKVLIAGTGCESTRDTIELTRQAADLGYGAALVRTPAYFKAQMSDTAFERHYRAVADASPVPILLYSVPQFTGVALEPPLVARLAEHPNIIGIKDSSGNVQRLAEAVQRVPAAFQVLVGSATTFYPSLCVGASGAILAMACVAPELCADLFESYSRGGHESAQALQRRLHQSTVTLAARFGVAGLKYAMGLRGYAGGSCRAPLGPLTADAEAEIQRAVAALDADR